MKQLNIISYSYIPNTAATNRLLALLEGLSENGVKTHVFFLLPSPKYDKIEKVPNNVNVDYCWEKFRGVNRKLHHLILYIYHRTIRSNLTLGDSVLLYGLSSKLGFYRRIKGVKLYHEVTESPLVIRPKNLDQYLSLCKKLDGLFVISENLKEYFISTGVPADKIEVINMVVNPERFNNLLIECREKVISYCGNLSNSKDGVDLLIKSFSKIASTCPDYKLQIIGSITPNNANVALVEQLKIKDRVIFTGNIPASEMPRILSSSSILALDRPDNIQAKYGFPTKLGEYLLTGRPVVVTRVGNIPSFLEDKISAVLSDPDDIDDFANQLLWTIEHPELADSIGKKGREVALANFNNIVETKKMKKYIQ